MVRSSCCDKIGLKKGPWTPEEDRKLLAFIHEHGHGSWRALPPKAGLQRCGKSCRLRWTNYLRPDIKRGKISLQEEQTIIQLHALLGNRWSAIASHLANRTDNEIKNYWNTHIKKKLVKMGIDPDTHKPKARTLGTSQSKDVANLSHMAQWESARLEAEARIVRESKLISTSYHSQLTSVAPTISPSSRPPCLDILKVWQGTWAKSRKDQTSRTPFFTSNGTSATTLESPVSILNFSDNGTIPTGELVHDGAFATNHNYVSYDCKGILGNSMQILDPITTSVCIDDNSLKYPYFLDDLPLSADVEFEETKMNHWSNILNIGNSPLGSPIF